MSALRRSKIIATVVLAWFVLFLGVAGATPWVNPDSAQMVCSGSGAVKWVSPDTDDGKAPTAMGMDCPLCAHVAPPAMPTRAAFDLPDARAHALHPPSAARIAWLTASPPPSRGPPA